MSETKFTPGPWDFLEAHNRDDEWSMSKPLTICGGDNDDLANIYSADDSLVSITREQAIANAHLIAAAPELYATLEPFARKADEFADDETDDLPATYENGELFSVGDFRRARAALRKARGDSEKLPARIDPRDPDPSRAGIFRYHNCWKCKNGNLPCVNGHQSKCEYPHARND